MPNCMRHVYLNLVNFQRFCCGTNEQVVFPNLKTYLTNQMRCVPGHFTPTQLETLLCKIKYCVKESIVVVVCNESSSFSVKCPQEREVNI